MEEINKTTELNQKAIEILSKLQSNHHNLRGGLDRGLSLREVGDSLNWQSGMIDAVIILLKDR